MREEIKNPKNVVDYAIWKQLKHMSVVRKTLQTKILVSEELIKID